MKRSVGLAFLLWLAGAVSVPGPPPAAAQSSGAYRSPQRAPSPERFKQIQLALKKQGYDPGPIDGRWGSKTSAALRRFEKDHEMPADGKLDALVLITLGLGPKRAGNASSDTTKGSK